MAKFIFKLQALLNLKMQLEDNIKNKLGKAIQRHESEKLALSTLYSEREDHIRAFNILSAESVRIEKLKSHTAYIALLKNQIEKQKENVKQAGLVVDKYREQLVVAVQERKMLENLKEKKLQEFIKHQAKEEQKIVDEVTTYKYANRDQTIEEGVDRTNQMKGYDGKR